MLHLCVLGATGAGKHVLALSSTGSSTEMSPKLQAHAINLAKVTVGRGSQVQTLTKLHVPTALACSLVQDPMSLWHLWAPTSVTLLGPTHRPPQLKRLISVPFCHCPTKTFSATSVWSNAARMLSSTNVEAKKWAYSAIFGPHASPQDTTSQRKASCGWQAASSPPPRKPETPFIAKETPFVLWEKFILQYL